MSVLTKNDLENLSTLTYEYLLTELLNFVKLLFMILSWLEIQF